MIEAFDADDTRRGLRLGLLRPVPSFFPCRLSRSDVRPQDSRCCIERRLATTREREVRWVQADDRVVDGVLRTSLHQLAARTEESQDRCVKLVGLRPERRAIRKRLADLGTLLEVWTNEGCVVQDPEERAARNAFIEGELLTALQLCFMTGFDSLPQDLTHADLADRLAAYG